MPRKASTGGRRRTLEQIDKDARALSLYCSGKTYRQISMELGWKTPAAAHAAVKRALTDRQRDQFDQASEFTAAVSRIQQGLLRCQEIIDTPHYLAAPGGKLAATPDGELVLDSGPKQRAITEMRHLNDQLILLMDLKPASKQQVRVITEDVVDQEIKRLSEEIASAGQASRPGAG